MPGDDSALQIRGRSLRLRINHKRCLVSMSGYYRSKVFANDLVKERRVGRATSARMSQEASSKSPLANGDAER